MAKHPVPMKTRKASRSSAKPGSCLPKIIQTMGLSRETVYIANILKCRPDTPGRQLATANPPPRRCKHAGPHQGYSEGDARLTTPDDEEWSWLTAQMAEFLKAIGQSELLPQLTEDRAAWQILVARKPFEKKAPVRNIHRFRAEAWDKELGNGGLIGDLTALDQSPIALIPTGNLRRFVPLWENEKVPAARPTALSAREQADARFRTGRVEGENVHGRDPFIRIYASSSAMATTPKQAGEAPGADLARSRVTPMLRQYFEMKSRVPDAILFYRMGDFYEMFFEDAKEAAPLLGIALTARHRDSDIEAPMCGVPWHSADHHIARLVAAGRKVAICDQVEDPARGQGTRPPGHHPHRHARARSSTRSRSLPGAASYLAAVVGRASGTGASPSSTYSTGRFHAGAVPPAPCRTCWRSSGRGRSSFRRDRDLPFSRRRSR